MIDYLFPTTVYQTDLDTPDDVHEGMVNYIDRFYNKNVQHVGFVPSFTGEILGDSQMYENGITTLKYIFVEYFAKDIFHTRAISFNEVQLYDNISTPIFDQNYKAPLATLLTLLRKWSTVSQDSKDLFNRVQNIKENLTHLSLQNPLSFGESLRGLTYPDEAYRKVEIPHAWIKNNIFHPYISNFSQRFAINYHTKNEESWEIGNLTECEIRGEGIEEFKKIFSQAKE